MKRVILAVLLLAACEPSVMRTDALTTTAVAVQLETSELTWLHAFGGTDGNSVRGGLVEVAGRLYGLAGEAGPNASSAGCNSDANWSTIEHTRKCPGALFSVGRDGSDYRIEHAFAQLDEAWRNVDGYHPYGSLVAGAGGWLYGVTQMGGTPQISAVRGAGVLFRFSPAGGAFEILRSFPSGANAYDGRYPMGTVAPLPDGRVCGANKDGGTQNTGTVWCWSETGFDFAPMPVAAGGAVGGVTYARGKLHGVSSWGGTFGKGTYFTFDPTTLAVTVVESFDDYGKARCCDDNTAIVSPLRLSDRDETLLIAREFGGPSGMGLIARLDATGIRVLRELDDVEPNHPGLPIRFSNATGALPNGPMAEGCDGMLYGTTLYGGANGTGTVYQIDRWNGMRFRVLYSFGFDSGYPYGGLALGSDCAVYGTTFVHGRVFRFVPRETCGS